MTSKILRVFLNTDLRNSHVGLSKIAQGASIITDKLKDGHLVVFINKTRTLMKVYGSRSTLVFTRSTGQPIDLSAIQYLPRIFNLRKKVDINQALRTRLLKKLPNVEIERTLH